jgi:hypothetical protein
MHFPTWMLLRAVESSANGSCISEWWVPLAKGVMPYTIGFGAWKGSENAVLFSEKNLEESPRLYPTHRHATTDSCEVTVSRRHEGQGRAEEDKRDDDLRSSSESQAQDAISSCSRASSEGRQLMELARLIIALPDYRRTGEDRQDGRRMGSATGRSMTAPGFRFRRGYLSLIVATAFPHPPSPWSRPGTIGEANRAWVQSASPNGHG